MKNLFIGLILFSSLGAAQNFENEDYIYLKRQTDVTIDLKNGKFNIKKNIQEVAKYQTANKLYYANDLIHFDSFTEIKDIEAFTYLPESSKKIDVNYIETKREFDNGIFYSDQESKNFTFPSVSAGAETHLTYTEIVKDPHFMELFRFGTYVPTKYAALSIECPKNVTLGFISFNAENIQVDFKKTNKKRTDVYTWTAENINSFQGEDGSEGGLYYIPHIITYIKSYKKSGKQVPVLNDVSDLYNWYSSLVNEIDVEDLNKVYTIAESITKDIQNPKEKAETIFNWVQDNINYVAFEDGLGGFIPRGAASVCEKRYGDCKDMANLLYEMLNHVGLEAYRTWIGTRDRPYSYQDVPTPIADNHMIAAVVIKNDTLFLDATDSYVPFGMPSEFTQSKEALIGINESNFIIKKVPVQAPSKSKTVVTSNIVIDGSSIRVDEQRELSGYEKVDFMSNYTYKKEDKTDEEFLNTTLALGNNKTSYTNISQKNFNNKATPLELSYNLKINNYIKSIANKTYINLNIDRLLSKTKIDIENRKYSKKINHKYEKHYQTTLHIPEGYVVKSIPKPIAFNDGAYGFSITHELKDDKIIQLKNIYINTLSIKNKDFEHWNSFIKNIIKAYKKSIILENTL